METTSQAPPQSVQPHITGSARALLTGLIDYAGLFPPAALSMEAAVANYAAYLRGPYRWLLGRFIVPVARLNEFEKAFAQIPSPPEGVDRCWKLSAISKDDTAADVARILEFNYRGERACSSLRAEIESIELKDTGTAFSVERTSNRIPSDMETYFEIPLTWRGRSALDGVAKCRRRAKIRLGGEAPHMFPSVEDVFLFLQVCAGYQVPFKATAGLHHAIRGVHRCTDQPNRPQVEMHGFLNLFLAAASFYPCTSFHPGSPILQEENRAAFRFHEDSVEHRMYKAVSLAQISAARREFATSFGSCSFTEPTDDLRSLHLL